MSFFGDHVAYVLAKVRHGLAVGGGVEDTSISLVRITRGSPWRHFSCLTFSPAPQPIVNLRKWSSKTELSWTSFFVPRPRLLISHLLITIVLGVLKFDHRLQMWPKRGNDCAKEYPSCSSCTRPRNAQGPPMFTTIHPSSWSWLDSKW